MAVEHDDDDTLHEATRRREPMSGAGTTAGARMALTILMHPHIDRVGDVHVLEADARSLEVSRLAPDFRAPRTGATAPIKEAYVSRSPAVITVRVDGGATVSTSHPSAGVSVAGTRVEEPIPLSPAEVERGVVLGLGPHVCLLLHGTTGLGAQVETYGLTGESDAVQRIRQSIKGVGDMPTKVLLLGGTGTGKELVARAIHGASDRSAGPFIAVNMANLQEGTAASELFGHARGAFSGADRKTDGYFGAAHGGTLFLDEIGETSMRVQQMLLRALNQDGASAEVQPVGESRARIVDVRTIAATDADLDAMVANRSFDDALAARLLYRIELPPLRERLDDVGRLIIRFAREVLDELGEAHRLDPAQSDGRPWLSQDIMVKLLAYDWPGNIRELRNTVHQLAIYSRGRPEAILDEATERRLARQGAPATTSTQAVAPAETGSGEETPSSPRRAPSTLTEEELLETLAAADWSKGRTAKTLSISRTTLDGLLKRFGIKGPKDLTAEEIRAALVAAAGDRVAAARALKVSERGLKLQMTALGL